MKRPYLNTSDCLTLLEPREKPHASRLIAQARNAILQASTLGLFTRMEWAHETRDAIWDGKQADCRKRHGKDGKKKAFPWEGAPDTEVRLVDGTINEMTDIRMAAFERADLSIAPRSMGAGEEADQRAGTWRLVAAYYLDLFEAEMLEQAESLADTAAEYGHGVMRIDWRETRRLEERTMDAEAVSALFVEAAVARAKAAVAPDAGPDASLSEDQMELVMNEVGIQLQSLLSDPAARPELVELCLAADPDMPRAEAVRVASAMQQGKPAVYYAVTTDESRPQWRALIPWVHVWYDPSVTNIGDAQWVCETEWLDEVSLRERATTEGWDAQWLEQVLLNPGGCTRHWGMTTGCPSWVLGTLDVGMGVQDEVIEGRGDHHMFQIAIMHYRASSSSGVPCTYRTVFHPGVTEHIAHHEVCSYASGRMPYVDLKNERRQTLVGQRGVAELGIGAQGEMKLQRDARGAQIQLRASPPLQEPIHQLSGDTVIRPGERLPLKRTGVTGEYKFLQIPAITGESVEMENTTLDHWNDYWGRGAKVPPDVQMARRQRMVNRFLTSMREAIRQTFQLIQQYTDDIEASTIAGQPVQLSVTREEIQGQFDLSLKFDVTDLNLEHTGKILEFISTLLVPLDTNGVVDRNELVRFGVRKINPELAARVVRPGDAAMRSEIDDEDTAMAKMVSGIEPPFLTGKAHAARAARLTENMQKNPQLQAMYDNNEIFRALLDNRIKQHEFQTQQQENAVIGRIGGKPVLSEEGVPA